MQETSEIVVIKVALRGMSRRESAARAEAARLWNRMVRLHRWFRRRARPWPKEAAFKVHVHLVFVAKYRSRVFDGDAVKQLRTIFTKVCTDFEAQLIEMDGENDHVHLLVEYPPKVAVSNLVNSLKGRKGPTSRNATGRAYCGRHPTSPHPVAAHQFLLCASTSNSSRHH